MVSFDQHKNLTTSSVNTAPIPALTGNVLILNSGDGASFPIAPFNVLIYPAGVFPNTLNSELVRVYARNSDTLNIYRAQEGSSARSIIAGDLVSLVITKKTLTDIEDAVNALDSGVTSLTASISNLAPIDSPTFTTEITTPTLNSNLSLLGDGTLANPSIAFNSDQTVGLFKTMGKINFGIAGVNSLQVTNTGLITPGSLASGSLIVTNNATIGTLTSTSFITTDGLVRVTGGMLQIYDEGFASEDPTHPYCALITKNGILSTSDPIAVGTMPTGTVISDSYTSSDNYFRIKNGLIQIWDSGYYEYNSNTPWCGIVCNNGVLTTTQPISTNDTQTYLTIDGNRITTGGDNITITQ